MGGCTTALSELETQALVFGQGLDGILRLKHENRCFPFEF
jgi:hypothetical protein